MSEEVMKNIYRIEVTLPNNPMRYVNSYVITGEDKNLIIDTGFRTKECYDALTQGLKELNVDLNKTDILLTHIHSDHVGLVADIIKPGRKVFTSRKDMSWLYGESRIKNWVKDTELMARTGFDVELVLKQFAESPSKTQAGDSEFSDYTPLDDGDVLEYGGYKLKAILTPGHTPAHMCFYMEDQKAMFTGDHVLFDISPNITLWHEMDNSLGAYLDSLKMIDSYDVKIPLPGHRKIGDFHARIAKLLKHHEVRLDECASIVEANPNCCVCDVASKMKWSIRCNSWEDFPLEQKWFAVAECHSHLRMLERQGRIKGDYSEQIIRYKAV